MKVRHWLNAIALSGITTDVQGCVNRGQGDRQTLDGIFGRRSPADLTTHLFMEIHSYAALGVSNSTWSHTPSHGKTLKCNTSTLWHFLTRP